MSVYEQSYCTLKFNREIIPQNSSNSFNSISQTDKKQPAMRMFAKLTSMKL